MARDVVAAALDSDPRSSADPALPATADLFARSRILIVDDRDTNILLLDTILRAEGVVNIEGVTGSSTSTSRISTRTARRTRRRRAADRSDALVELVDAVGHAVEEHVARDPARLRGTPGTVGG